MAEIIPYSIEHREQVSALMEEFYKASLNDYGQTMDAATIEHLEEALTIFLMMQGDKVIGVIAGLISKQLMSHKRVFQEIVWYVDKDHRGQGVRLLRFIENWCAEEGIVQIIMARMHNSMPDTMGEFYERMGYKPFETHYIKDVG